MAVVRHIGRNPSHWRKPQWGKVVVLAVPFAAGAWFLLQEHRIAGSSGFPLDDSWIYATFARNLATGHGYSFNPGESIGGATGPLYVFVLALLYLGFKAVVWPAKVLGLACLSVSALLIYEAMKRIQPGARGSPLLAGLLVGLSPPLVWGSLSGLELPLYLLFACLGLYCLTSDRWTATSLSWGVGIWLRPDGMLLALLSLIARPRLTLQRVFGPLIVITVLAGAYFAFNVIVGGSPLPTSVIVKSNDGSNVLSREWSMATQWLWLWGLSLRPDRIGPHAALLVPAIVVGAIASIQRWPILTLYLIGFPVVFAMFGPSGGQHARYIAYVIPFGILLACIGFHWVANRIPGSRFVFVALGVICICWQVYTGRLMGIAYGWNVQNINGMHRFIAEAARRATAPGDTVAVNDVGAMGYFSGCYVVDLVGLVTFKRSFPDNLHRYKPKYMIVFPEWYQSYATIDPHSEQTVFYDPDSTSKYSPFMGVQLKTNTIASRNTMYLFERIGRDAPGFTGVKMFVH